MNKEFFERIEKGSAHVEGYSYLIHQRSWGSSVVLDAHTRIYFINNDGEPSAHFHRNRTEDYILHTGEIEVYRGQWYEGDPEKTIAHLQGTRMFPGDRIVIPPHLVHVPINRSPHGSVFIEISHGPYAEGDIERVYDKQGRDIELTKKWSSLGYETGISITDLILLVKNKQWIQPEKETKAVIKPWGNGIVDGVEGVGELWLNYHKGENVGDKAKKYVFKKLYVKAGTKMSLQYHVNKLETNHLISGRAEAWLENDTGEIERKIVAAGDSWTIPCGRKHRIIALTDMVMLEASTPEVDDVIRIEDDTGRPDGRIDSEHQATA